MKFFCKLFLSFLALLLSFLTHLQAQDLINPYFLKQSFSIEKPLFTFHPRQRPPIDTLVRNYLLQKEAERDALLLDSIAQKRRAKDLIYIDSLLREQKLYEEKLTQARKREALSLLKRQQDSLQRDSLQVDSLASVSKDSLETKQEILPLSDSIRQTSDSIKPTNDSLRHVLPTDSLAQESLPQAQDLIQPITVDSLFMDSLERVGHLQDLLILDSIKSLTLEEDKLRFEQDFKKEYIRFEQEIKREDEEDRYKQFVAFLENKTLLAPSPLVAFYLDRKTKLNTYPSLLTLSVSSPLGFDILDPKLLREASSFFHFNLVKTQGLVPQKKELLPAKQLNKELQAGFYSYYLLMGQLQKHSMSNFNFSLSEQNANRQDLKVSSPILLPQIRQEEAEPINIEKNTEEILLVNLEKRNWFTSFENSIQLSQNYITENWHKGGNSNLNLHTRTFFGLQYRSLSGKIMWTTEVEDKLGLYSTTTDGNASYRLSEDLFRLRTNFGIRAFKHWYYSFDAEGITQLFNHFEQKEKKDQLQTAFLAPLRLNSGLGMKFDYRRKGSIYGSYFQISANIAPLSLTYKGTVNKAIDLSRQGLSMEELHKYNMGSTLKVQTHWQFDMDISWTSRLYFNTSYKNVEAEWENTINMKIGRYFSTRINLQLRYDSSIPQVPIWYKNIQANELLSFGFNFKI